MWRQEKFWACHEALEEVWQREIEPRRSFLNGLIHGAVAIFQFRRGNWNGAARQLLRAQIKLEKHLPTRENLDLHAFLRGLEAEILPAFPLLSPQQHHSLAELENRLRISHR